MNTRTEMKKNKSPAAAERIRKNRTLRIAVSFALLFCLLLSSACSVAEYSFSADADAIEKAADSVFMLEVYSSSKRQIAVGSGFVAFDSSLLVTNYHVIENGSYVVAVSDDQDRYLVSRACCIDKKRDIAILCFDQETNIQPLPLDTDGNLKRSQTVVAIGNPAGLKNTISRTLLVPNATTMLENETRALYYDPQRHLLLIGNKKGTLFLIDKHGNRQKPCPKPDSGLRSLHRTTPLFPISCRSLIHIIHPIHIHVPITEHDQFSPNQFL